jgi:hypothetical protein
LPGCPGKRPEQNNTCLREPSPSAFDAGSSAANRKYLMQNLSPRHVKTEESVRLGVVSGWYSTKVSGTFVSGPHDSEADCLRRIAEIDPQPVKIKT